MCDEVALDAPIKSKHYAVDVNQQAASISHWEQIYNQHSNGTFWGHLEEVKLPSIHLFEEYTNQALHQNCCVGKEKLWLGFTAEQQAVRINGADIKSGGILCRPAGVEFELNTPKDFTIFGIVVDMEALNKRLSQRQEHSLLNSFKDFSFYLDDPRYVQNLAYLIKRILHNPSDIISSIQQDTVLSAVLDMLALQSKTPVVLDSSHPQRKRAVQRVINYIHDSGDFPVTIEQLCEIACVSRRTLQYSFETVVGISPIKFIRYNRLNRIRRELLNPESTKLISQLANQFGFFHLGQFDFHYKSLFGETPTETLARANIYAHGWAVS